MKLFEIKTTDLSVDRAVARVNKLIKEKKEPICLLMVGMPASGKSTFLRKLETLVTEDGAIMLPVESSDAQVEAAAKKAGQTYTEYMKDNFAKTRASFLKKIADNVNDHVKNERGFIIDQTMLKKEFRSEHLSKLSDSYYKICITFEIDEKILTARLEDRFKRTGKSVPPDVIEKMKQDYQRPEASEGFDEIILIK